METGGQTKLLVRPMTERDLPETASLERLSISVPWSETLLSECLDSRLDLVWVLEEERGSELQKGEGRKKIAGYCNLRIIAGEAELMRIAVHPDLRGRGYARILMDTLVRSAREQGASVITLEVRNSNQAARNLYKSYGFVEEAVRKSYYTEPVEDAVIMGLRLS